MTEKTLDKLEYAGEVPRRALDVPEPFVKFGRGAVLEAYDEARALAETMVELCDGLGIEAVAMMTDMSVPLGRMVGNALEIREVIDVLRGGESPRLRELAIRVASELVALAFPGMTLQAAQEAAEEALTSGRAFQSFRRWVAGQGGDPAQVDEPHRLPQAAERTPVAATSSGYVTGWNARSVGEAALWLGAGRRFPGDVLDLSAGVELVVDVGSYVDVGQLVAVVHSADSPSARRGSELVSSALELAPDPPAMQPIIREILRPGDSHSARKEGDR